MRRALPITNRTPSRGEFQRWLRRVHGWMGLWGAMMLWTRMRGSRLALTGLCGGSLGLALLFVLQSV